jgi:hypothetical protein
VRFERTWPGYISASLPDVHRRANSSKVTAAESFFSARADFGASFSSVLADHLRRGAFREPRAELGRRQAFFLDRQAHLSANAFGDVSDQHITRSAGLMDAEHAPTEPVDLPG